jgi:hypothetical protein
MLFISGYTDRAMFDAMIAERELTILEKSLSAEGLVARFATCSVTNVVNRGLGNSDWSGIGRWKLGFAFGPQPLRFSHTQKRSGQGVGRSGAPFREEQPLTRPWRAASVPVESQPPYLL